VNDWDKEVQITFFFKPVWCGMESVALDQRPVLGPCENRSGLTGGTAYHNAVIIIIIIYLHSVGKYNLVIKVFYP
jgi:hypothetical protein